jgi:hypothetical protein
VRAFLNISLPKLRRAGGALASLAHVPFIGNALTASAKAPEAWGYGISSLANTGGSAMATAAVTGLLIAAPISTGGHQANAPVEAAAMDMTQSPSGTSPRQDDSVPLTTRVGQDSQSPTEAPTTTEARSTDDSAAPTTGREGGGGSPTTTNPLPTSQPIVAPPTTAAPPTIPLPTSPLPTSPLPTTPPIIPPTTSASSTPSTINGLISMLAPNPDAYGDRGSNLLDKLRDLQDERSQYPDSDHHVTDTASDLIDDVHKWLGEGRLDPTIGAYALQLLTPIAG